MIEVFYGLNYVRTKLQLTGSGRRLAAFFDAENAEESGSSSRSPQTYLTPRMTLSLVFLFIIVCGYFRGISTTWEAMKGGLEEAARCKAQLLKKRMSRVQLTVLLLCQAGMHREGGGSPGNLPVWPSTVYSDDQLKATKYEDLKRANGASSTHFFPSQILMQCPN
jgi:hypothetical protein